MRLNQSKYLSLLSMLYITFLLLSTVLVYKLSLVYGIIISTGTFVLPVSFWLGDIISEVYGYQVAKRIIIYGLICLGIFDIGSYLFVSLPSPLNWTEKAAYASILGPLPRIFFADIVGFFIGSTVNVYLVSRWKILLKGRYFWLRSIGASFIGEIIFTLSVMAIIFFHHLNFATYLKAAFFSLGYKTFFSIIFSYPGQLLVSLLNIGEGNSTTETLVRNPFKT